MSEYISKQSVIDYLNGYLHSIGECGADSLLFDRGQRRALINSIQDISAAKASDVQPVAHAKWVCHEPEIGLYYSCSRCGHNTFQGMYKFCPNCGAKMDGEQV